MPDQREQKGCHVKQNGGQPGAEWRAIGSKIAGNREQKVGFGKRKARNFGVCALLLFVLLPGPTCRTRLRAGPDAAGGRLVELVLDEELDGLVFCHSEFVVEDCGVVVSLLCAEPEFSLV